MLDPSMQATPVSPVEWRERLKAINNTGDASNGLSDTDSIVLDVRNGIT